MTCKEFIDFLIEYYEGSLPADRRRIFEQHMDECPDCVAYLESYRKTVELAQEAGFSGDTEAYDDAPPSLIEAILAAQPK